ncbi:MAG: bifunctional demethylmenaquinone methyltransferase/2-methoxy-6-polyprenyl-1,4-benzoquinol methylase UbiE [SAR86 cluster bacterium]|jgi:demethylmenaquinone methyltransferase/2-methoxy-6-polyprenyl-1,4-benzoquinol methylase|nr:bifunctional demethylmenaquinone methyltransferase/2-methoxy-6-polyprenyl-1,4-benzoquinol methylase UbiE [SAR86 cluster bacterium]
MNIKSPKIKTHFGFEQIDSDLKSKKVREVFDSVVEGYDLMNDLMSFGIHRIWKRIAVEMSEIRPNSYILDLAGGTGDMVRLMVPKISKEGLVILSDINENMLVSGRDKLIDSGVTNFNSAQIDAQLLPFKKDTFDLISIAFGLRNVTDKKKTLRSILQCLKPGGRLIVLEFSKPTNEIIREFYDLYSFEIIPKLGEIVLSSEESYRYLAESIRMHPNQDELKELFEECGFEECNYENLTNGVVAIHTGDKPKKL